MFTRNGWLASADRDDFGGLNNDVVPGTAVLLAPGVRDDEAGQVLRLFAARFHLEVEGLVRGWCWGYAWRKVREGAAISEHAAAVAIDLNAPWHGLGERGTFTAVQLVAIRRLLAVFSDRQGPLLRWGGDFSRPDEMHFELIGNLARCKAFVATYGQVAAPVRPLPEIPQSKPTPAPAPPADTEDDDMKLTVCEVDSPKSTWVAIDFGAGTYFTLRNNTQLDAAKQTGHVLTGPQTSSKILAGLVQVGAAGRIG